VKMAASSSKGVSVRALLFMEDGRNEEELKNQRHAEECLEMKKANLWQKMPT